MSSYFSRWNIHVLAAQDINVDRMRDAISENPESVHFIDEVGVYISGVIFNFMLVLIRKDGRRFS